MRVFTIQSCTAIYHVVKAMSIADQRT